MINIRKFNKEDMNFLWDMLYEAIYEEDPIKKGAKEELLAIPALSKYVKNFGDSDYDVAFIAEDDRGKNLGVAWYRLFDIAHKGYGFISEDIPELSIAIKPEARGMGIGTKLMEAIINEAKTEGFKAMSLSVDPNNAAVRLYERFGFIEVGVEGTSITMKLDLQA